MQTCLDVLTEHAWNAVLSAVAEIDPNLYALVYWLHLAGEIDLDDRQIVEFLRALVRARAI